MALTAHLLLTSIALAGGNWTESHQENGCTFYKGATQENILPVRAVCDWPIDAAVVHKLLAKSGDHNLYFSAIAVSDVLSTVDGHDRVRQVHQAAGVSDREVMIDMYNEAITGGTRYVWKRTDDQSGLSGDQVAIAQNFGFWEVTGDTQKTHLEYELRYLAGGWVPGFMVRWFQGAGMHTLLGELRSYASK
jgi:hypothetical protein